MWNREVVEAMFEKHPELETFIGAGVISLKLAREILQVDREYMYYEVYIPLVKAGAVVNASTNSFRASPELRALLEERRGESGNEG